MFSIYSFYEDDDFDIDVLALSFYGRLTGLLAHMEFWGGPVTEGFDYVPRPRGSSIAAHPAYRNI